MKEVIGVLEVIVWPAVVLSLAFFFSGTLRRLLVRVKEFQVKAGGVEASAILDRAYEALGVVPDSPVLPGRGPSDGEETPETSKEDIHGRTGMRMKHTEIQNCSREIYLGHVLAPSSAPEMKYDVFVYIHDRGSGAISEVDRAEFFFGKGFGNRMFKGKKYGSRIGRWFSVKGEFLCTCLIIFTDGRESLVYRSIDFHMGKALEKSIGRAT